MINDKLNDYISLHPRECLRLIVISFFLIWQSVAAILGIILYLTLKMHSRLPWWVLLGASIVIAGVSVFCQESHSILHMDWANFFHEGLILNVTFWKSLLADYNLHPIWLLCHPLLNYILGFPFLIAGLLSVIDLIPNSPYQASMEALQKGKEFNELPELDDVQIMQALKELKDEDYDGTVLGVSKYTGTCSVIFDRDINQIMLVLGTTGGGKTITLRRFYKRAITKGYPLIIVDGKPDEDNINWLMKLAHKHGRRFVGFNCGNYLPYDPLANGGYTELKDKIISLKDEWSSDYYRSIAEDYLQATFEVLLKSKKDFDMRAVVECLNYDDLAMLARATQDPLLMKRVEGLEHYDRKDITGLQACAVRIDDYAATGN